MPLRSQHPEIARQDTDGSTGGSSRSGRNLANIDTMRANSYNANRPPTMNMSWDFPVKAHNEGHPNLDNWTPDAGYGSPSDDFESSYDEAPYPPPKRPTLRHAATEPIHVNEDSNKLNIDLARGSRLDMDALMGGHSVLRLSMPHRPSIITSKVSRYRDPPRQFRQKMRNLI